MEVNIGEATSWYVLKFKFPSIPFSCYKEECMLKDLKSSTQANMHNLVSSSMSHYKVTHKELFLQCFSVLDNQPLGNSNGKKKFQLL